MFQKNLEEISKSQDEKPTSPINNLYENLKRQIECYDKLYKIGRGKEASPFLLFKIIKGKEVFIRQCLAFTFRHFALPKDKVKGEPLQDKNFFNPRFIMSTENTIWSSRLITKNCLESSQALALV